MSDKTTKVMQLVRDLLARAEHPNTPAPEQELCFQRAHKLMLQHAIDEAALRSSQTTQERRKPVVREWGWMDKGSEYSAYLRSMLDGIVRTNRCEAVIGTPDWKSVTLVGFSEDADWCEMLYTSVYYSFLRSLFPKWNKELTIENNIYVFKKAGYKWQDIWNVMVSDHYGIRDLHITKHSYIGPEEYYTEELGLPVPPTKKGMDWMFRQYRKHARSIGDTQHVKTQRFDAYRLSFAEAYAATINARLEAMRETNAEAAAETSNLPALRAIEEDVNEALWDKFPSMHPDAVAERRRAQRERMERERIEREEMLMEMTPAQRNKFFEEEQKEERRRSREYDSWYRRNYKSLSRDSHGAQQGEAAAQQVNLTRSSSVTSTSRKELD